jgi:hypothetical protein
MLYVATFKRGRRIFFGGVLQLALIGGLCFILFTKFFMSSKITNSTYPENFEEGCRSIVDLEDYYVAWGFNTNLAYATFKNGTSGSPCDQVRGLSDADLRNENLD